VKVLAAQILTRPNEARQTILAAFRKCGAHRRNTAIELDCGHRTFDRWVAKLGLEAELAVIEEEAKKKGWHHGNVGGRPALVSSVGPQQKRKRAG